MKMNGDYLSGNKMYIRPEIFSSHPVTAAQSTRHGGISRAPFDSLNMGFSTADLPENIFENRSRFYNALNIPEDKIVLSKQVHGKEILFATAPGRHEGYDAIITNVKGLYAVVSVADCTPVLVYDPKNKAIAAIHAGWRGTAQEIVAHTMGKMKSEFGTQGEDCLAWIGACIGYEHFEVGEEVAIRFPKTFQRYDAERKKYFVDLKSANLFQLEQHGVGKNNVEISSYCTISDNDRFFSYRKEKGLTGRMIAVMGMHR